MLRLFSIFVVVLFGSAALAESMTEQQKIDALLSAVGSSDITFIRNGEAHDGAWAKQHLAKKLKAAKPEISTADDFITKIASTSSHSGKAYLIKTPDGKTVEASAWLQAKLADLNKPSAGATDDSSKQ